MTSTTVQQHDLDGDGAAFVSTGRLPLSERVQALMEAAYEHARTNTEGRNSDVYPALEAVPSDLLGLCLVSVDGATYAIGDTEYPFAIMSVSKPFVFALVCQALGGQAVRRMIGVNGTGLPFNSVMAVELGTSRLTNPMVNPGALATTSLVPGASVDERWHFIHQGLSRFAGRPLELNDDVYKSASATNQRNHGISHLLRGYGVLYSDPAETTDLYTRQCSLSVTARDLAVMSATLADGGVNPVTLERVIDANCCPPVLAVMATAGLYETSGDWLYEVGLPGKSGIGGGIITVAPGKGGMSAFAPRLDDAGNSVKGQLATRFLSEQLGLNMFASKAVA
jgi:glutaminase